MDESTDARISKTLRNAGFSIFSVQQLSVKCIIEMSL